MKAKLLAAALLILPMWVMLPLERSIRNERLTLAYGPVRITRAVRDQIPQGVAIALLAGFRGVVADFIWIGCHGHWERKEWLQQASKMQLAAWLQPRSILFWDVGAWHMAWNIGYAERVDTNNYTLAQGLKREQVWHERAREFLERGIANNPNQYELYAALARLYADKLKDPCQAAAAYEKAAALPGAPSYLVRMQARLLEQCGETARAYAIWVALWSQDQQQNKHPRTVLRREIERLEQLLQLPANQRLFPPSANSSS